MDVASSGPGEPAGQREGRNAALACGMARGLRRAGGAHARWLIREWIVQRHRSDILGSAGFAVFFAAVRWVACASWRSKSEPSRPPMSTSLSVGECACSQA